MMAFEFLGGACTAGGRGTPTASPRPGRLPRPRGRRRRRRRARELPRRGSRSGTHDPVGWPTFKDWPAPDSLTHEQVLPVAGAGLARRAAHVRQPARRQRRALRALPAQAQQLRRDGQRAAAGARIRELERYIDAQTAGPGEGWFRIVTDPFEARRVINEGKLAVVLGIETCVLFGCTLMLGQPAVHRRRHRPPARRGLRPGRPPDGAGQQVRQRARGRGR